MSRSVCIVLGVKIDFPRRLNTYRTTLISYQFALTTPTRVNSNPGQSQPPAILTRRVCLPTRRVPIPSK